MPDTRNNDRHEPSGLIASDAFSVRWHELTHNPGAVRASSTITIVDEYRHTTTWTIDTFRVDGAETVFLQRIDSTGGLRILLPPAVTTVIDRQHDRATTQNRKRVARQVVATRIARGDTLGNPTALAQARKARKAARRNRGTSRA